MYQRDYAVYGIFDDVVTGGFERVRFRFGEALFKTLAECGSEAEVFLAPAQHHWLVVLLQEQCQLYFHLKAH